MKIEEATLNSGRFGWQLDSQGARLDRFPKQWGEPNQLHGTWHIRWSNGVSEFNVPMADLRVEWMEEAS